MAEKLLKNIYTICTEGYEVYLSLFNQHVEQKAYITYGEGVYLDFVYKHENTTVSEIALAMGVSKPAATQVISRLEEKGYIEKTISESDKRKIFVNVSSRYNDIERRVREVLNKKVANSITAEQLHEVIEILDDVVKGIKTFNNTQP